MNVERITIDFLRRQAGELFELHYQEVRGAQEHVPPIDPDWLQYGALEQAGMITLRGLFDGEALVGYALAIYVPRHLHYRVSYAQMDVMFVHPDYRRDGAAKMLADEVRAAVADKGAEELLWHAVPGSRMHALLDNSARFQLRDYNYSEKL